MWNAGPFQVLLSEDLLAELSELIVRPRILRLHGLSRREIDDFIADVRRIADIQAAPLGKLYPQLRDPDHFIILAAVEHLRPDTTVTGDKDLLVVKEFQGIPILSPRHVLARR